MAFIVSQIVAVLVMRELSGGSVNRLRVRRRNHRYYLVMPHDVTIILVEFFRDVIIDLNGCISLCAIVCKISTSSKLISLYLKKKHAPPIVVKSPFNTGVTIDLSCVSLV